jgi:hypothetical protein
MSSGDSRACPAPQIFQVFRQAPAEIDPVWSRGRFEAQQLIANLRQLPLHVTSRFFEARLKLNHTRK